MFRTDAPESRRPGRPGPGRRGAPDVVHVSARRRRFPDAHGPRLDGYRPAVNQLPFRLSTWHREGTELDALEYHLYRADRGQQFSAFYLQTPGGRPWPEMTFKLGVDVTFRLRETSPFGRDFRASVRQSVELALTTEE